MKKLLAIILAVILSACFTACGNSTSDSDMAYVKEKGKLVVGITDFEPMDYKNENGEWIGFDADLAKLFAEKLGVDVEFVQITWGNKIFEINSKTIDVVWNGMTLNEEVKAGMDCSVPYLNNGQIVVLPADKAADFSTVEACRSLNFAVEDGSAGEKQALANGFNITEVEEQANALMEVATGTCDAAIIDSLMAGAMVGEGTDYAQLTTTIKLNSEEYGVGFRKGSDLVAEFNAFYEECKANGTLAEIADKYGVQEALIK